jgi:hypothetical protein
MKREVDALPNARIPADIDTPDKILYGLTARQAAILAVTALGCYALWRGFGPLVSPVALVVGMIPIAGAATVVALGRRDGLSMDQWLIAAARSSRTPRRLVPAPEGTTTAPGWAPDLPPDAGPAPGVLRLPAEAIDPDGTITTGPASAATMVATTTVNIGLRTGDEQWALLGAYGRWLNSLTGPVQVVVSAQRADLTGYAARVVDTAAGLANDALADAAADYADFLLDLATQRDPLWRTITVVSTAHAARNPTGEARRRGEHAATALSALGVQTRLLDGPTVTAVITAATDPYQYADASWPRSQPHTPITAPDGSMP